MNEDAQRVADMLAEVVQALNDGLEYEGQDAEEFLTGRPLEITVHAHTTRIGLWYGDGGGSDAWTVDDVRVLLGTGGPAYHVKFTETDQAVVEHWGWFGSDFQSYALSPELAEQLAVIWGIDEVLS